MVLTSDDDESIPTAEIPCEDGNVLMKPFIPTLEQESISIKTKRISSDFNTTSIDTTTDHININKKQKRSPSSPSDSEDDVDHLSEVAGLTFPVKKALKALREGTYGTQKVGSAAPVYLTAVLEYMTTEVLELAGKVAKNPIINEKISKKLEKLHGKEKMLATINTITPHHIEYIFKADSELHQVANLLADLKEHALPPERTQNPQINDEDNEKTTN